MARNYIDCAALRLTVKDKIFMDAEFFSGEKLTDLEPRRLFPVSGLTKYISFLNSEGEEQFIIRDIEELDPESKKALLSALDEYYRIPQITRLVARSEKHKIWMWTVETDKGEYTFEIINHLQSMKIFHDRRVIIKDANDNRYEIPDVYKLDKRSIKLLLPDL